MADRGFQIKKELFLHFYSLEVLPGALMKSQMISVCKSIYFGLY